MVDSLFTRGKSRLRFKKAAITILEKKQTAPDTCHLLADPPRDCILILPRNQQ